MTEGDGIDDVLGLSTTSYTVDELVRTTGLPRNDVTKRLAENGIHGKLVGEDGSSRRIYTETDEKYRSAFPELGQSRVNLPAPIVQAEEAKSKAALMSLTDARNYISEQVRNGLNVPANKMQFCIDFLVSCAVHNTQSTGRGVSRRFEKEDLESDVGYWVPVLKRGLENPSAKIDASLLCNPSLKEPGEKAYKDFSKAYDDSFKEKQHALDFAVYWFESMGRDGEEIVRIDKVHEISKIIEKSFSPRIQGYRRASIEILLSSYLRQGMKLDPKKPQRRRGRKPKEKDEFGVEGNNLKAPIDPEELADVVALFKEE